MLLSAAVSGCGGGSLSGNDPVSVKLERAVPKVRLDDRPVFVGVAPGDTQNLYVVTQPGRIFVVENRDDATSKRVFIDLRDRIRQGGEDGLLGLAFHPDFASNGMFYVYYSVREGARRTRVSYFIAPGDRSIGDPVSERVLLDIPQPDFDNHKGGSLAFGADGMLYVAVGDGGGSGDPQNRAQDLSSPLGKILRLRSDGGVPADNPYVGEEGVHPHIWAFGFRNPWRISFDRSSGGTEWALWAADVGQDRREEINLVSKRGNYGWRRYEGTLPFNNPDTLPPAILTPPVFEYAREAGNCSIIGGYVYRGSAIAWLVGRYVYADFCSGRVWALSRNPAQLGTTEIAQLSGRPTSFGEDASGELYVAVDDGEIYRIKP
jgi:glucose/arabinose dehydrogenase